MTSLVRFLRAVPLLLLAWGLCGCDPPGQSQLDEEKEPHFQAGKSRVNSMDFPGAVEAFEKAIELNPRSASAHFELGWLFDQKREDPAAAIYHYDRYLRLRPNADKAGLVKQRILACKQELAKTVSLGPVTETVQRELERMSTENKRLTEQNNQLRADLKAWMAYAASLQALTNQAAAAPEARGADASRPQTSSGSVAAPANTDRSSRPAPTADASSNARTHTVKSGETIATIARKYGVSQQSLLSANPYVNPKRLKVGQTLSLPAR
jgi:LysM repeat protein